MAACIPTFSVQCVDFKMDFVCVFFFNYTAPEFEWKVRRNAEMDNSTLQLGRGIAGKL